MCRLALAVAAVATTMALMTTPATGRGHGCCCVPGGTAYYGGSYYVAGQAAGYRTVMTPSGRVYSYQPGAQPVDGPPMVTAPATGRAYSYAPPQRQYSFGVRGAAAKPNFNYAPHGR